jgi:phosphatidylglycerophosphate synthase
MAFPNVGLLLFGIATDWIDGAIARRGGSAQYGPRFDLEADSVLTLGAAIAAARHGRGTFLVVAPVARYAVIAVRDPSTYSARERFWDRVTGIAQMAVLVAALSPFRHHALSVLAGPVATVRCAALAAALIKSGAVQSTSSQATGGGPLWSVPRGRRP